MFTIRDVKVSEIRDFIEMYHYSHSINGINTSRCFGLYNGDELIGAAIFGRLAMAGLEKKYQALGYKRVIELRRLVLIDDTPKNTESWFIGRMLRKLKADYDLVVSYADPDYGHSGVVYRASNFYYYGMTAKGVKYRYKGKLYHDKSLRSKGANGYKPFSQELRDALAAGNLERVVTESKFIYLYSLNDLKYRAVRRKTTY